jgi:eukaryotic-like serine/threonine-protein kinase
MPSPTRDLESGDSTGSLIRELVQELVASPALPGDSHADDRALVGETVGRYRIVSLLGKGGMGRVYEAEDLELGRRVAIKFLAASVEARGDRVDRFLRERSVTAELEHPGIVPVYDSGVWQDNQPFYVMRKVSGAPLDQLIRRTRSREERLALLGNVLAATDAVGFAHHHGVIHRDLKPANILVASFGETLVADWGLAKRVRGGDADEIAEEAAAAAPLGATRAGAVMGTPAYMAPEQARGDRVDERSDVYAIGAILEELLTGTPAPEPTSSLARALGARHLTRGSERLDGALADLAAIADKAMAPTPADRYANATELADELRRFQTGQFVDARRYTWPELLRRWALRHRAMLAVGAGLGTGLVVVAATSVVRIVHERDAANRARSATEAARREAAERNDALVLLQARAQLERDPTASLAWLKTYPVSSPDWKAVSEIASDAWSRGVAHDVWRGDEPFTAIGLAFSVDGALLAAGSKEKGLHVWNVRSDKSREARWLASDIELGGPVTFSSDGRWVASSNGRDAVRLWDLATGAVRAIEPMRSTRLRFTTDGKLLLGSGRNEGADVWDAATGSVRAVTVDGRAPSASTLVPGEHSAALVVGDSVFVEDLDTTQSTRLGVLKAMAYRGSISASADRRWVAVGADATVLLFDRKTGESSALKTDDDASGVLFAPDGTLLSFGNHVRWWDLSRREAHSVETPGGVTALAWSSRGAVLVGGTNGHLGLHHAIDEPARALLGHDSPVSAVAFSPDGSWAASSGADRTVRLWRVGEGDSRVFQHSTFPALSGDGRRMLACRGDGAAEVIDVDSGTTELLTGPRAPLWPASGAISPDGHDVILSDVGRTLTLVDFSARRRRTLMQYGPSNTLDMAEAFSPDGALVAVVATDSLVQVVEVATGERRILGKHDAEPTSVAFSPDGRTLATAARDRTVRLWDPTGVRPPRVFSGHAAEVSDVRFSRDGRQVVSAGADGTVRVWNVESGEAKVLRGHTGAVNSCAFSPDGRMVLSGGTDRTLRLWDVATGEGRLVRRSTGAIQTVAFSPDGESIVWSGGEGDVRMGDPGATPGFTREATGLRAWLEAETTAEVDASGELASKPAKP